MQSVGWQFLSVGWQFFLSVLIHCYYGNILDTIVIVMKGKEKPTGRWHTRNTHLCKQVVLSRIFKHMVPVDYSYQSKKKYQEPFCFTCPSNSFASFLSLTSNLVHHSPNLSTWSPRFPSHDWYLCCWSLASRAKHSFYFGPLKTNGSNSKLSLLWLHNLEKNGKELWRYKHHCSLLLSFNRLFAPYNSTWKNVFIIY